MREISKSLQENKRSFYTRENGAYWLDSSKSQQQRLHSEGKSPSSVTSYKPEVWDSIPGRAEIFVRTKFRPGILIQQTSYQTDIGDALSGAEVDRQ
jgi:hypothetical protein